MGSYIQEREIVRQLGVKGGEQWRGDCLFCGGENTLSVRNDYGTLMWRCFRASCVAAGKAQVDMAGDELVKIFTKAANLEDEWSFQLPEYWLDVTANNKALDYIEEYGCDDAYLFSKAQFRYDPRQDRLVFLCMKGDKCYDAAGRALTSGTKPKWLRYGVSNASFFCPHKAVGGRSDHVILVEDAASACSASRVMDSVAILGTHFSKNSVADLMYYKCVYIALDPDALEKAYSLQKVIDQYRPAKIVDTLDDLKYYNVKDIQKMITEASGGAGKAVL